MAREKKPFTKPLEVVNKAYRKQKVYSGDIELFRTNLLKLLQELDEQESEEHLKNDVIHFLNDTWYKGDYAINTKDRTDLVIHNDKTTKSTAGVLLEVKKPSNKAEMVSNGKLNAKALQELVLYYLRERIEKENTDIKHLVVTNVYEWFVFDANTFYEAFYKNTALVKEFKQWNAGQKDTTKTELFYKDIAAPTIEKLKEQLTYTWFDFREFEKELKKEGDSTKLISLYKLLSPVHLLKQPFANDSNSLNKQFYHELLHIIGLEETKDKGKKIIQRKEKGKRDSGSLLENAMHIMDERDRLRMLDRPSHFGKNAEEQAYNVGLELCITWINRVLFLKLLESQLVSYHKGDKAYKFLDSKTIPDYDVLDRLFFGVLARKQEDRHERYKEIFAHIPYLNSSLFEPTGLEEVLSISMLSHDTLVDVYSQTILKDDKGKRISGKKDPLTYLFEFLEAYDFASEGKEAIQDESKSLINASVLGLIFEKINGYKDGSFYTPGFITMYMCRETIRRAVVQKFNEAKGWALENFDQLYDKIEDKKEANDIINSLKICDPAVGSGHFLVSALNEIIAIKSELRILIDKEGKTLRDYDISIENDELIITDDNGAFFDYTVGSNEKQRVQETLFHEKQTIIENCLFGVDINPNSVKICRLRLWIELLKNSYYLHQGDKNELQTLPNIDINIKTGNSLISRFDLDTSISKILKGKKWTVSTYKDAVESYKNANSKEEKREFERLIEIIKRDFRTDIAKYSDRDIKDLNKLGDELFHKYKSGQLYSQSLSKKQIDDKGKLEKKIEELKKKVDEKKNNPIYDDAFEWRFEFPEVMDDEGSFKGFDAVIGNPPYFSLSKSKEQQKFFESSNYKTFSKGADIYCLFYERGSEILKELGLLTYITSNSWLRAIYGEELKNYFIEIAPPIKLLNIEDLQVFEEATVESNIITLQKAIKAKSFPVANLSEDYQLGDSLADYFDSSQFTFDIPITSEWFIGDQTIGYLKNKIEAGSKLLGSYNIRINFGIKTGYNEAFIIDEQKRDELIDSFPNSKELIHPIIRGRDLKKFSFTDPKLYVIGTFPTLKIQIELYPAIERHFHSIGKRRLEQSGIAGSRKKTSNKWFETQDSIAYWEELTKPKIVWGEISDKPKFAFDNQGFYNEATTFLMTGEKLKFLLAILNSKVSEWYFNLIGTTTGMGTNRWKKYKIELLPIKVPTDKQEAEIEQFVNQIIEIKGENRSADTTTLEKQIDQLVYKLYGLTEEEIKIVEGEV